MNDEVTLVVEERHTPIHGGADQCYAFRRRQIRGVAEADAHAAEADGRDFKISKFALLHD